MRWLRNLLFLLILTLALPVWAATSLGGIGTGSGAGSSFTIATGTFSVDPVAGSTIACSISDGNGVNSSQVASITDTPGTNTWTLVTGGFASEYQHFIWYAKNVNTAASFTVTATLSFSVSNRRIICAEIKGAETTESLDVSDWDSPTGLGTGTDAVTAACCPITTTVNGAFIFAAVRRRTDTATISAGTGMTEIAKLGSDDVHVEYQVQSTAGTIEPHWTWTATGDTLIIYAAFKPSGGAAGFSKRKKLEAMGALD